MALRRPELFGSSHMEALLKAKRASQVDWQPSLKSNPAYKYGPNIGIYYILYNREVRVPD